MKPILPFLFVLFSGLASAPAANAEVISGLYEAEVPVADKGQASRRQAVLNAFRDVLVKVSGYSGVLDDPAVSEAVARADSYLQQFRYSRSGSGALKLWVQFNSAGVERLLEANNLPMWGGARPVMVIWLAVEEQGARRLVGTGDAPYAPVLQTEATSRGIPVRLPLLDLTDRSNISPSDVWGDFRGTILEASRRYDAQAILAGRLYQGRSGGWRVRWALYGQGDPVHWEESGGALQDLLAAGVNSAADTISLRYTRSYGDAGEAALQLRVEGVSGLQDFNRTLRYLESLSGVSEVEVTEMGAGSASFRLSLSGPRNSVTQALKLGDVLAEEPSDGLGQPAGMALPAGMDPQLVYRLLK